MAQPDPSLDSQILMDADSNWQGFASRPYPAALPRGIAQLIHDGRLERGSLEARRGILRVGATGALGTTIWGSCLFYDSAGVERIVLAATSNIYVYTPAQTVNGTTYSPSFLFPAGMNYPSGRDIDATDSVDVLQVNNQVYIFRGKSASAISVTSATRVGTTVTITTALAHGYATGDEVSVAGAADTDYNGSFVITVTGATTFTFTALAIPATSPSAGTIVCVKAKPALVWNGSTTAPAITVVTQTAVSGTAANCPPGDFALYYQNRLIVPYTKDKIGVSDIFDFNTFDLNREAFRVNLGSNDSIVGITPWVGDRFLVFQRRSIYDCYVETTYSAAGVATLTPGSNSYIRLLTDEVGCVARKSVVPVGPAIFFLSDRGIHSLVQVDQRNLTVNVKPISDDIDDWIRRINFPFAHKACAKFWNNRYYIALPIDGAQRNNYVFVFNTLLGKWESIDRLPDDLYIDNWLMATYSTTQALYFSNQEGGVFVYEAVAGGDDSTNTTVGGLVLPFVIPAVLLAAQTVTVPIQTRIKPRRMEFGSPEEKRFSKVDLRFNTSEEMELTVVANVFDPDATLTLIDGEEYDGSEDVTRRARIASKGCGLDLDISFYGEAPSLDAIAVTAISPSRNTITRS